MEEFRAGTPKQVFATIVLFSCSPNDKSDTDKPNGLALRLMQMEFERLRW